MRMMCLILPALLLTSRSSFAGETPARLCETLLWSDTFFGETQAPEDAVARMVEEFGADPGVLTSLTVSVRALLDEAFARYLLVKFYALAPTAGPVESFNFEGRDYVVERPPGHLQIHSMDGRIIAFDWLNPEMSSLPTGDQSLQGPRPETMVLLNHAYAEPGILVIAAYLRRNPAAVRAMRLDEELSAREEYFRRARHYFNRLPEAEYSVDHRFRAKAK